MKNNSYKYSEASQELVKLCTESQVAGLKGNLKLAIEKARQAIVCAQDRAEGYETLALAYIESRDFPRAQKALDFAVKLHPTAFKALGLCGFVAGETGRLADAIRFSRLSLKLEPQCPDVLRNLGWYTFLGGQESLGESILQEALSAPGAERIKDLILLDLGNVMLRTKRWEKAKEFAREAKRCGGAPEQADKLFQLASDLEEAWKMIVT